MKSLFFPYFGHKKHLNYFHWRAASKTEPDPGDYSKKDQLDTPGPAEKIADISKSNFREQPGTSQLVQKPALLVKSPSKKTAGGYDSDDSNYVASDDEVVNADDSDDGGRIRMDDLELKMSSDGKSSSNVSTPNTSPVKLPVSILKPCHCSRLNCLIRLCIADLKWELSQSFCVNINTLYDYCNRQFLQVCQTFV